MIIDEENEIFNDKTKFKKYLSTNPALQRILERNLQHKVCNHTPKYIKKTNWLIFLSITNCSATSLDKEVL